ncbi:MAG TPA: hypothetical protein V6D29_22580 [Leptolyngbyaceae cyanobacterium]
MPSKSELQSILKEKYGINKNVSQSLSLQDCEQLLTVLQNQPSAAKLVESFVSKNSDLGQRNRYYGQLREQSEKKLKTIQAEHQRLEKAIAELENSNTVLGDGKQQSSQTYQNLDAEIKRISEQNQSLVSRLQTLTVQNDELIEANDRLKKDNKELKNIVDQIRLRLARDTKALLQYEDSEIRKALIQMFRWTLG